MKTKITILKRLMLLGGAFAATAAFGQVTQTWNGAGDGTNVDLAADYASDTLPNPANNDTAEWDGVTTGNLFLINNTANFASGPGQSGINVYLSGSQTEPVNIQSTLATSQGMAIYDITVDPGAGALTLGGTNTSRKFYIPQRPSGAVHAYVNNSSNPATLSPWIWWRAGGGAAYTLDFSEGAAGWPMVPKYLAIGIGMWLGTIMWFNVWFVIWPNQQKALNIGGKYADLPAPEKAAAARTAGMFSRINTLLSIPMLFSMVAAGHLY